MALPGEGSVQVVSLKAHLRYWENYYKLMGFKELKEEFCIKKTNLAQSAIFHGVNSA
jgi:hypothetical protein